MMEWVDVLIFSDLCLTGEDVKAGNEIKRGKNKFGTTLDKKMNEYLDIR